jgi:hypothetical protein
MLDTRKVCKGVFNIVLARGKKVKPTDDRIRVSGGHEKATMSQQ